MNRHHAIITYANRFEAVAADGFEGAPYIDDLRDLAEEVRASGGLVQEVANALGIMTDAIRKSDPAGRFAAKIAILDEAILLLVRP